MKNGAISLEPYTDSVLGNPAAGEGFGERLVSRDKVPYGLKKSCFSLRAYKSLFSWDTGLPHLGLLLIEGIDETEFSHSDPYQNDRNSALMESNWSWWLCRAYLGRQSQKEWISHKRTDVPINTRTLDKHMLVRRAQSLFSRKSSRTKIRGPKFSLRRI